MMVISVFFFVERTQIFFKTKPKQNTKRWAWWCISIIAALKRLR
jgi:hypothetical protein